LLVFRSSCGGIKNSGEYFCLENEAFNGGSEQIISEKKSF